MNTKEKPNKEVSKCCGAGANTQPTVENPGYEKLCSKCDKAFIPKAEEGKCERIVHDVNTCPKDCFPHPAKTEEQGFLEKEGIKLQDASSTKKPNTWTYTAKTEGEWEEEFDNKFVGEKSGFGDFLRNDHADEMESFIRSLLLQKEKEARAEMVGILERMRKEKLSTCCKKHETYCEHTRKQMLCNCGGGACPCGNPSNLVFSETKSYNQALDDIINLLSKGGE